MLGGFPAACRSGEAWGEAEPDPGPRGGCGVRIVGLEKRENPLSSLVPAVPADGGRQQQLQQLPRQVLHRHCSSGKAMFVSEKFPHLAAYPTHLPSCPVCRLTPCLDTTCLGRCCVNRSPLPSCPRNTSSRACLRDTIGLHSEGYACCEGKEQNNSRNLSQAFKSAPPIAWISSPRVRYIFTGLVPRNCLRVRINVLQLSSGKFRRKCALTKWILKDER